METFNGVEGEPEILEYNYHWKLKQRFESNGNNDRMRVQ